MNSTKTATLSLWVTLTCLVGFGMFVMKNQVQTLENELNRINRSIQDDVKSIHVLKAEWSHLNSPSRLKTLANKHILLNPGKPEQIINYSALPLEGDIIENPTMFAKNSRGLRRLANSER